MKMKNKGFTLVEIMLVIGIVALLASIAIPNLIRARIQSNEAAAQSTLRTISTALENYFATNSQYPSSANELVAVTPPYLNKNYFSGTSGGYDFTVDTLTSVTYAVTASPASSSNGATSYTISTGGVLVSN